MLDLFASVNMSAMKRRFLLFPVGILCFQAPARGEDLFPLGVY